MFMHTVRAYMHLNLGCGGISAVNPSTAPFCSRAKKYLLLSLNPHVTTFATGGPN